MSRGITVAGIVVGAVVLCVVTSAITTVIMRPSTPPHVMVSFAPPPKEAEPEPSPAVPDPPTWSKADPGQVHEKCRVKLARVEVKRIPLLTGLFEKELSKEPCFSVAVQVSNISNDRIVHYAGWASSAELRDDRGNIYHIDGRSANSFFKETLRPGDESLEVIVFEMPLTGYKYLDLSLPSSTFLLDYASLSEAERKRARAALDKLIGFRIPASEVSK